MSAKRFFIKLLIIQAILFCVCTAVSILIIQSDRFYNIDTYSIYDARLEVFTSLKNQEHKIVLIGDSSLQAGIDPRTISRELGLSTISMGLSANSGDIAMQLVLDRYLAKNKAPEKIVLFLSPRNLRRNAMANYEKTIAYFRYRGTEYFHYTKFSFWALYKSAWTLFQSSLGDSKSETNQAHIQKIYEKLGYVSFENFSKNLLQEDCNLNTTIYNDVSTDFLPEMRKKYNSENTKFYIFISPLPECDKALEYYQKVYRGLIDNEVSTLPNTLYMHDGIHLNNAGAKEMTDLFINQFLKQRL